MVELAAGQGVFKLWDNIEVLMAAGDADDYGEGGFGFGNHAVYVAQQRRYFIRWTLQLSRLNLNGG